MCKICVSATPANYECHSSWAKLLTDDSANINNTFSTAFAVSSFFETTKETKYVFVDSVNPSISRVYYLKGPKKQLTVFQVPQSRCPKDFAIGILNVLNFQRYRDCLNPLVLSEEMNEKAQEFVQDPEGSYPSLNQGFLNWGKNIRVGWWFMSDSQPFIKIGFWEPFSYSAYHHKSNYGKLFVDSSGYSHAFGNNVRPKFRSITGLRKFNDKEWKYTSKIGIGCRTYYSSGQYWQYFFTSIHFNYKTY